jgi:hypothetical protein
LCLVLAGHGRLDVAVKDRLAECGGFRGVGILQHGFAPHTRDHDIAFEALWGSENWADRRGTYRLRLTHCPKVVCTTAIRWGVIALL